MFMFIYLHHFQQCPGEGKALARKSGAELQKLSFFKYKSDNEYYKKNGVAHLLHGHPRWYLNQII
jgi:hypothetical protein